jgi:hypothetical protein
MGLKEKIPALIKLVNSYGEYLKLNDALLKIYNGGLLPFVEEALALQLSKESYQQARKRIPPINVLEAIQDLQPGTDQDGRRRSGWRRGPPELV